TPVGLLPAIEIALPVADAHLVKSLFLANDIGHRAGRALNFIRREKRCLFVSRFAVVEPREPRVELQIDGLYRLTVFVRLDLPQLGGPRIHFTTLGDLDRRRS